MTAAVCMRKQNVLLRKKYLPLMHGRIEADEFLHDQIFFVLL